MLIECAPLAGYTDRAFRRVLIDLGAKVVWTEMVSVAAIYYGQKRSMEKTLKLLEFDRVNGVKTVVQLFGKDPKHFEFAINYLKENRYFENGFDEVNINMGCPAGKIMRNGEGAALMTKPDLAREIVEMCVRTSPVPVSVKMRLDNVMEIAKICQAAGANRIIVHGRTAKQGYTGTADWNAIAEVIRAVKIPVIANGDIRNMADARRCLEITGAAGVMIGRVLLTIYRKYFPRNVQTLSCAKIQSSFTDRDRTVCEFFSDGRGESPNG